MKLSEFKTEWGNIELMKIFEIPVIDKRTGEDDYIIFDIDIVGRSFIASHVALSTKQDKSKKIAFVKHVLDLDFSIDKNLQELSDICWHAINDSEYFKHKE